MRSGYNDDCDDTLAFNRWRGMVASAMRGRRGQQLLKDILAALDSMPMPMQRLIPDLIVDGDNVCALGAAGKYRKLPDIDKVDPEAHDHLSTMFDVAECLIQEIEWVNDEAGPYGGETAEKRFVRVRKWLVENIRDAAPGEVAT